MKASNPRTTAAFISSPLQLARFMLGYFMASHSNHLKRQSASNKTGDESPCANRGSAYKTSGGFRMTYMSQTSQHACLLKYHNHLRRYLRLTVNQLRPNLMCNAAHRTSLPIRIISLVKAFMILVGLVLSVSPFNARSGFLASQMFDFVRHLISCTTKAFRHIISPESEGDFPEYGSRCDLIGQ